MENLLMNMMLKKKTLKGHISLQTYVLDNGLNRFQFGTVQTTLILLEFFILNCEYEVFLPSREQCFSVSSGTGFR
jgi:hypothetical protein